MMKKLCFTFFLGLICLKAEAKPLHVEIGAKSAILMNVETGAILFEKNPHLSCYPASITKIATALYALEKKGNSLDQEVTAVQECLGVVSAVQKLKYPHIHPPHRLEPDGTTMGIKNQETLSLRTLLYGLMLSSGNDAANLIAHHVSGSVPQFMEELNSFLKKHNIQETVFNNPHGLHHPEHKTTAYDMARITCVALKHPLFCEIVKTLRYERPQTNKQPASILVQHNQLLKRGPYFYPYACGIKTGYHSKAGYTLVAAAKRNDRFLVVVILNALDLRQRYKDAIALFETAFAEEKIDRLLFTREHEHFSSVVRGAKTPAIGVLEEDFRIQYYPTEEIPFKACLRWKTLEAPIKKGTRLGEIQLFTQEGKILKVAPLFAKEDVEMTFLFSSQKMWQQCSEVLIKWKAYYLFGLGFILISILFVYVYRRGSV